MSMTFLEANTAVTGPGQIFELIDGEVRGVKMKVFKNAPAHLGQVFAGSRGHGDKTFLVYEDEIITFAQAADRIDALASLLVNTYGVKKGDRVAVAMRNFPEWVMSFAAIISVGAINVSMNSWWTEDEMDFALEDSGATVLICDQPRFDIGAASCVKKNIKVLVVRAEKLLPAGVDKWEDVLPLGDAHPGADISPDDDATILYTSGTTGRPKGAVSTHRAIISSIMAFSARSTIFQMSGTKLKDVDGPEIPTSFILIVPLFHVTGCVPVMLSCFVAGLKLAIMYKWDPEKALEMIEREQITNFVGVPTQSWDLVNSPAFEKYDTSSLRAVGGGGAPSPTSLVGKVNDKVKNGNPQLGYGMTETNAFGPAITGSDYLSHPTSTGRASWPMVVEVRDENLKPVPTGQSGEIWFFGPMLIRGYWNRPDATAETIVDGWLRSGDLGRLDADGYVYVEDRVKDMILRAGENVYGAEVESAIYEHPAIHEAAVFGVPHERLGEEVGVAILVNDGMTLTPEELWAFLDVKIAKFKIPTQVVIMTEPLPRNAAGKFLKRELQQHVVKGTLTATSR
ncbi:MAG: AMP-binding protein [Actinobacteria bacterium]|nr:AMP-binding protein [Actinomycetota bacterium]MDA2952278.1 AMP-binding protein [Actinomycetota bacterium]MDA2999123.1 AMP-binding protein [Actinomycetota bacterium]